MAHISIHDVSLQHITGSFLDENVTSSRHRISGTGSDFRDEVSGSLSKKVYN
jgi:hypothetical protein